MTSDPNHADILEGDRGAHIAPVAPRSGGRRSPAPSRPSRCSPRWVAGPAAGVASAATGAPVIPQAYGPTVTITGHGFGHGEGMGQWGAYGYATVYKWQWQQILAHYYGGTTLGATDPNQPIAVRLEALDDRPFTAFVQEKGLMATTADGLGRPVPLPGGRRDGPQGVYAVWGRADGPVCPDPAAPFDPTGWVQVSAAHHLVGGHQPVPRRGRGGRRPGHARRRRT